MYYWQLLWQINEDVAADRVEEFNYFLYEYWFSEIFVVSNTFAEGYSGFWEVFSC